MRRAIITVLVVATCGLTACSKGSASNGGSTSPATSTGSGTGSATGATGSSGATGVTGASGAAAGATGSSGSSGGSSTGGAFSSSALKGLTKLNQAQLCGLLSTSQASQILGATTAAGVFANTLGLGITCVWTHGSDQLYIGISTLLPWSAAEAIDKLLQTTTTTIDGHQAIVADKQASFTYAQIDVELGGDNDPVVEYRAPSVAIVTALATAVTPKLLALAG